MLLVSRKVVSTVTDRQKELEGTSLVAAARRLPRFAAAEEMLVQQVKSEKTAREASSDGQEPSGGSLTEGAW